MPRASVAGAACAARAALGALALSVIPFVALQGQDAARVEGAWRAQEYALASGPVHPVRGHILFAGGDWNVLFFVLDDDGTIQRVSAEGGTYTLRGEDLVFTHLYYAARGAALEGLPAASFEMRATENGGTEEAARIAIDGDRLTLFFPSGNRMTFVRAPG